jgi:hypothetical protein
MTNRHRRSVLTLVVVILVALVLGVVINRYRVNAPHEGPDVERPYMSVDGLSLDFTVKKYAKLADLVVVATPVSDNTRPFSDNTQIPEAARSDEMYSAGYHDVTVEVAEYLKGTGPDRLSVRRLDPPPGVVFSSSAPKPVMGKEQVMFLSRGDGLWTGGYLVMGEQALGEVSDEKVILPSAPEMSLGEFRRKVRG